MISCRCGWLSFDVVVGRYGLLSIVVVDCGRMSCVLVSRG